MHRITRTGDSPNRVGLARLAPRRPVDVGHAGPIGTPRMTLRPLAASDRDEFLRVIRLSRAHLDAWFPLHHPGESDEALFERQLELARRGRETGKVDRRVGVLGDGSIAGAFNVINISRGIELRADANWWLSAEQTGRGLGREGVGAMIGLSFAPMPAGLGLHVLNAWIVRGNERSIRLALDLGFQKQGAQRSFLQTGDRWQIHDLYVRSIGG